jgi:hypothetical protein
MGNLSNHRFSPAIVPEQPERQERLRHRVLIAAGTAIWVIRLPEALPQCIRAVTLTIEDEALANPHLFIGEVL